MAHPKGKPHWSQTERGRKILSEAARKRRVKRIPVAHTADGAGPFYLVTDTNIIPLAADDIINAHKEALAKLGGKIMRSKVE